jgi:hypothetical protein
MAVIRGWKDAVFGLAELEAQFARIEKMPKKYLTKASKAGMKGPLADARASAPTGKTGNLKRSIKQQRETPNKRNKAVYRLVFSSKYTDAFVKPSSGALGGKPPTAYYPHSIEYGFKIKDGKVKGRYFITNAINKNQGRSLQIIVDELNKAIDELTK